MSTKPVESKTIPQSAAQYEAHHTDQLFKTVRDYLTTYEIDDQIIALATAFNSHIDYIVDEDEDCLTIPVENFKTQAYAFMDLIGFLAEIKKHWQLTQYYSAMHQRSSKKK